MNAAEANAAEQNATEKKTDGMPAGKRPTVLLILDGYGLSENQEHNAIAQADTPVMDRLMKECPFVKGNASGEAVGLPDGQMGSSEVGHLNMGAGRIVYQDLVRITKEIENGDFFENEALLKAMNNAKEKGTSLHIYGLLSDGGVHSHNSHLYALLEMAKRQGVEKVYVHCFTDGRDTPPESGKDYVRALQDEMDNYLKAVTAVWDYTQEMIAKSAVSYKMSEAYVTSLDGSIYKVVSLVDAAGNKLNFQDVIQANEKVKQMEKTLKLKIVDADLYLPSATLSVPSLGEKMFTFSKYIKLGPKAISQCRNQASEIVEIKTMENDMIQSLLDNATTVDGIPSTAKSLLIPLPEGFQAPEGTSVQQLRYFRLN